MTCREKLKKEHPERINPKYLGGCGSCPVFYYPSARKYCEDYKRCPNDPICTACWDQPVPDIEVEKIPEPTEQKPRISNMLDLLWFVEKVMANGDKMVSIDMSSDNMSINVYPYKEEEDK